MTAARHCSRRDNGIGCFVGDNRARGLHANERVAPLNTSNAYTRVSRAQRCSDRVSRVDINVDSEPCLRSIRTFDFSRRFYFILYRTHRCILPHDNIDKCFMSRGKF